MDVRRSRRRRSRRAASVLVAAGLAVGGLAIAPGAAGATTRGSAAGADARGGAQRGVLEAPAGQCPTEHLKRQLRGEWVASVVNIDWPSKPGLTPDQQQAEYSGLLDDAQKLNLNAMVVQVRPTADSFYPSSLEPWSQYLTGTQGKDPGYDPLAYLVQATHARNLEFHAWINPYRVSMSTDLSKLSADSVAKQHPDWIVSYGGKLYLDPGIPAAREHVEQVVMDIVNRYDVDGIHFDDYFYPYPSGGKDFPDDATFAKYGAGFTDKGDWRRNNINTLMRDLDEQIHAAKPWVKFGVSPFGVWRNQSEDPTGSATTAGAEDYSSLYADTRAWIRNGWVDYINPQIYWSMDLSAAAYRVLVPWWANEVKNTDVALYIGEADYKVGTNGDPAWHDPQEILRHLEYDQQFPEVDGNVWFSAKDLRANRLGATDLLASGPYAHPALVPVIDHLGGSAPHPVALARAESTADGVRLSWPSSPHPQDTAYYAVYRLKQGETVDACTFATGDHLVATVRRSGDHWQTWTDDTAEPGTSYTYYVTALDRLHHESRLSPGRTVRAGE